MELCLVQYFSRNSTRSLSPRNTNAKLQMNFRFGVFFQTRRVSICMPSPLPLLFLFSIFSFFFGISSCVHAVLLSFKFAYQTWLRLAIRFCSCSRFPLHLPSSFVPGRFFHLFCYASRNFFFIFFIFFFVLFFPFTFCTFSVGTSTSGRFWHSPFECRLVLALSGACSYRILPQFRRHRPLFSQSHANKLFISLSLTFLCIQISFASSSLYLARFIRTIHAVATAFFNLLHTIPTIHSLLRPPPNAVEL